MMGKELIKKKNKKEARCPTCHKLLNMRVSPQGYISLNITIVQDGDKDKKEGTGGEQVVADDLCTCQQAEKKK